MKKHNPKLMFNIVLAALLTLGAVGTSTAQIGPPPPDQVIADAENTFVRILTWRTGQAITPASPFYNDINNTLRVQGEFEEVPFYMDQTNLRVTVNGTNILTIPGAVFGVDPPVGLTRTAGFTVDFPMSTMLPEFPMFDLAIELVFLPNEQTVARDTITLYDLRFRQGITLADAPDTPGVGINYQLTDYGLGGAARGEPIGIEELVLAEYPQPSLEEFNTLLGAIARELPGRETTGLRACVDLADLGPDQFRDPRAFDALRSALLQARGYFFVYQTCVNNGAPGCNNLCVNGRPRISDFELCVDTLEGEPVGARVEDFTDLELAFVDSLSPGLIEADMKFTGYQAQVDLRLRDLRVRWKESACALRPAANVDNADIPQIDWLNDWATCPATEINATEAVTAHIDGIAPQFAINEDPTDPARLYISDFRLAEFGYNGVTRNADIATCGEDFIFPDADAFLGAFVSDGLTPLDAAVNDGQPETALSQLLDEAFTEMAIGLVEPDEYFLNARINSVATSTLNGLMLDWETLVQPQELEDVARLEPRYLTQSGLSPWLAEDSLDPRGKTISSKFGLVTSWINQVLWARGATAVMNQVLVFTEAELGISGDTTREVTQFDGGFLANVYPAFTALTGKTVELRLERQVDPAVFQPEDPSEVVPEVGWPLRYGAFGVRLYIKSPDKVDANGNPVRGEDFVSLDLNFYEPLFGLISSSEAGDDFLEPLLPSIRWQVNVLDMDIPGCQKYSREFPPARVGSCEAEMESALRLFLLERLERVARRLTDQIPAPQYFALEGDSDLDLQTTNESRLHQYGSVDVFDLLVRP
jgi:hypothetical protein